MTRHVWLLFVVGALLALAIAVPAAGRSSTSRCSSAAGETVVQDVHIRVFRRRVGGGTSEYFACRLRAGRVRRVVRTDRFTRATSWRIAGRYVAYARRFESRGTRYYGITLFNALWGRDRGASTGRPAPDLLVTPGGTIAWIDGSGATLRVMLKRLHGEPRVLDAGPGVAPGSLARAGSTLYWTTNGQPESVEIGTCGRVVCAASTAGGRP